MNALTIDEAHDLARFEGIVVAGMETFIHVSTALMAIRTRKLHRYINKSFDGYCRERFGFSRGRGYQISNALEVAEVCTDGTQVNEREARQVLKIARHEPDNGESRQDKLREILARIKRDEKDNKQYADSSGQRVGKDWRETAEAKLQGAMKAWSGKSPKVERILAVAWAVAVGERARMAAA